MDRICSLREKILSLKNSPPFEEIFSKYKNNMNRHIENTHVRDAKYLQ